MKSFVFSFQQFSIRQEYSAMKVGTDGVLLGAWAKIPIDATAILDIGTGTGLIALMLAQRFSTPKIDAIEIDLDAYKEAQYNFIKSPWFDRLSGFHSSLDDFVKSTSITYDAIVCNPPFYIDGFAIPNPARDKARSNSSMTFLSLFKAVDSLLNPSGSFSMVIPILVCDKVMEISKEMGFYPSHETRVRGNEKAPFKRCLLTFTRKKCNEKRNDLTLEIDRNRRTQAHQKLVNSFYLSHS